jgi:diacylglycerol kinase family enzyme
VGAVTSSVPLGRVALVVNGAARRGALAYEPARRALTASGAVVIRSYLVDPPQIARVVAEAVAAGCGLVVVGGGDGTVSGVAGLLADLPTGQRPVLAVLPLGTANDFARTLDLPADLAGAAGALATGKVVDVDLGRAGGAPFSTSHLSASRSG